MNTTSIIAISVAAVLAVALAVTLLSGDDPAPAPVASAPAPAQVETPADPAPEPDVAADVVPPSFDVVRISREGTGVLAGRSAPEAFVEVLSDGVSIGRVRANRDGEWVLIFDTPLEVGTRELTLAATLDSGATIESVDVVVIATPERGDPTFEEGGSDGVVAVLTPRDGRGSSRVLQRPGALQPTVELGLDTLDIDGDGMATFSGFAPAQSEVRIYIDNEFVASVMANEAGRWSMSPEAPVAAGDYVMRLDQIVEGDAVELRVEQPFNPASVLDITLSEASVQIQSGANLWNIARRVYGHGVLYTQIFQANQSNIVDPDLIYPGQRFVLPRTDSADAAE